MKGEDRFGDCPTCGTKLLTRALPWGELYCDKCHRYVILNGEER